MILFQLKIQHIYLNEVVANVFILFALLINKKFRALHTRARLLFSLLTEIDCQASTASSFIKNIYIK